MSLLTLYYVTMSLKPTEDCVSSHFEQLIQHFFKTTGSILCVLAYFPLFTESKTSEFA